MANSNHYNRSLPPQNPITRRALPARFDEQLNLNRKRSRQEKEESSINKRNPTEHQQHLQNDDRLKRMRSTDKEESYKNNDQRKSSSFASTTNSIPTSPMVDSKKRSRVSNQKLRKPASLFHRQWELYPSAREILFRRTPSRNLSRKSKKLKSMDKYTNNNSNDND